MARRSKKANPEEMAVRVMRVAELLAQGMSLDKSTSSASKPTIYVTKTQSTNSDVS